MNRLIRFPNIDASAFPVGDTEFEDHVIKKAEVNAGKTWLAISMDDGCLVGLDLTAHPFPDADKIEPGSHLRLYGKGFGHVVRGIFINGRCGRYQSPADHEAERLVNKAKAERNDARRKDAYSKAKVYAQRAINIALAAGHNLDFVVGASAKEWMDRYNQGQMVFAVVLGGLGFGYDEVIVKGAAIIIKHMVEENPVFDGDPVEKKAYWDRLEAKLFADKDYSELGMSGATHGAAKTMASVFWEQGPGQALSKPEIRDRIVALQAGKILGAKEPEVEQFA